MTTTNSAQTPDQSEQRGSDAAEAVLLAERARAERLLNGVRGFVLAFLAAAALLYAPMLEPGLRNINALVIIPLIAWTLVQYLAFHKREHAPAWPAIANPVADITAVTVLLAGYGLAGDPELALKTPVFSIYFLILAARPITSSTRGAAALSALATVEYLLLAAFFMGTERVTLNGDPNADLVGAGVSVANQGARVLFLALAGVVSTYATAWHERVLRGAIQAQMLHDDEERSLSIQLQAADKMSAVGALAASVAHEVASPLTNIGVLADLIRQSATDEQARKDAKVITDEVRRTVAVVRDLLQVARPQREPMGAVSVATVADRALQLLRLLLRDNHVTTEVSLPPNLPDIVGDSSRLEQIILNLIINAVQAMERQEGNKKIWVTAEEDGEFVRLRIEDSGPGFAPGAAEKCFDRFFTTKPAGKGTGLGLWVVRQIVEDHGGVVEAGRGAHGGAAFNFRLPTIAGRARDYPLKTPAGVRPEPRPEAAATA